MTPKKGVLWKRGLFLYEEKGYQNRAPSLLEPRVFFFLHPLEPRLEARYPLRAFRGFVPISGTPSVFFNFQECPFSRDSREFIQLLEIPRSVEDKGELDHFLEILENLEVFLRF